MEASEILDNDSTTSKLTLVVTGGANGIGLEVARQWHQAGGEVILLDLNSEALDSAVVELGPRARGIRVDVTDKNSVDSAMHDVKTNEGRINALVHCAGFAQHAALSDLTDIDFTRMIDVHLGGALRINRAAYPLLVTAASEQGSAAVVNMSSAAAINGIPGRVGYGSAKAGILGMTRTLAVEWGPDNIRINAVNPGPTRTALVDHLISRGEVSVEALTQRTPLRRMPSIEEVAAPIVFLCSPGANFITGVCLPIDGGLTIDGNWYA